MKHLVHLFIILGWLVSGTAYSQPIDSTFSKNVALLGTWQRTDFRFPEECRFWSHSGHSYILMTDGNRDNYDDSTDKQIELTNNVCIVEVTDPRNPILITYIRGFEPNPDYNLLDSNAHHHHNFDLKIADIDIYNDGTNTYAYLFNRWDIKTNLAVGKYRGLVLNLEEAIAYDTIGIDPDDLAHIYRGNVPRLVETPV